MATPLSRALFLLVLLSARIAVAGSGDWSARIGFNPDVLSMWGLELDIDRRAGAPIDAALEEYPHYRVLHWEGRSDGKAAQARLAGRWQLRLGERRIDFAPTRLRLDTELNMVFVRDATGREWLVGEMPHRLPGMRLAWRHMNLRVLPEAAAALGEPALADVVLGVFEVDGPTALAPKGNVNCRADVRWPSAEHPADIALTAIDHVAALRCRVCHGDSCGACTPSSQDGSVVVAPDARLVNVGASDVAWWLKFSAPSPPYGNDQHPLLVWSLYRIDADGALVPLGSSAVKHAFYAQNDFCSCAGDSILYRGCSDLYSASTNDAASALGPRSEIAPRDTIWGRCGSVFDPDCDGIENADGYATRPYERRLVVGEAELLPALHPGAEYWIEAWYVARDDSNLDNSFARRRVLPTKHPNGAWTFPVQGALEAGPMVTRWVDPAAPTATTRSHRIDVAEGRLQLAVRVDQLADQRWRYRYALMNLDYADADFSGTLPNTLRLVAQRGARGLALPASPCTAAAIHWRDGDGDAGNDWTATPGAPLQLVAPTPEGLGWGRMATLELLSTRPPEDGTLALSLGNAAEPLAVPSLVPRTADDVHCNGFEP